MNFILQNFRMERAKVLRLCAIASSVILMDQITKQMVLSLMPLYDSITIIPGLFHLTHLHNPGGAFGFLAGQAEWLRLTVFLGFSSLAVLVIVYLYATTPAGLRWLESALALIFGGAVGNLIDRLWMGKVVDFLDFFIGSHHWPAFNVADSAVSIGITIFIFHVVFQKIPQ